MFLLGACGSGAHTATGSPPSAPTRTSTAARGTATTTRRQSGASTQGTITKPSTATTKSAEYSFDDSVPPPRLVNTGNDYAAILKSLGEYGSWLGAHRPDPALASAIVARGTTLHDLYVQDITRLRDNHKRGIETLGRPSEYTILSTRPDAFSAKVVEDILVQKTVVASGKVTSEVHFAGPTTYLRLAVLVGGHWYLAASDIQRPVNVHL